MAINATQKFRLGVFVIIGMVILGTFIAIPLVMKMQHRNKTYYAYFEGESLQGLEQGAQVKFNGVSIGTVSRVSYSPDDINRMKVDMSVADNFPMRVDMYVTTGIIGITGLKYVEISGGSNEAELLKPGGVVPTRKTLFASIGERAGDLTDKVELLLTHLTTITNPDELRPFMTVAHDIMTNVADLTGGAKDAFGEARAIIPKVGTMADTVQTALNEAAMIMRDVKDVTANVRNVIAEGELQSIMAKTDSTVASIKTLTENLSLMVMQTREDFSVSMENLRETMESANQLMRVLSENPSLLIRGETRERDTR